MLDAVRGGGVRTDAAQDAAEQPHSVPADVIPSHVQLGDQPAHLRVEERRLPSCFRQAATMQATRHLRVQGIARPGAEEGLGGSARGIPDAFQHAQHARQLRRKTRQAHVRGEGEHGHFEMPDHRERGIHGL